MKLHIFNPENDLALADGGANYCAPPAAMQIARDLGSLPLWFAPGNDAVLLPDDFHNEYYQDLSLVFNLARPFSHSMKDDIDVFVPWGWSPQIKRRIMAMGFKESLLPAENEIEDYRSLSNRRTAITVLGMLKECGIDTAEIPLYLTSENDVAAYVNASPRTVIKAPWSGSGKGVMWGLGRVEVPLENFYRGVIRRQGGVVCEQFLDSELEFAMEFIATEGCVSFAGYSLFESVKGSYSGNVLAPDCEIEEIVSRYIQLEHLVDVRENLCRVLTSVLSASSYTGYLGVDMMVYRDADGCLRLNPCMEINLRMNMGVASRIIYDRHVQCGKRGRFFVTFYKEKGEAFSEHVLNKERYPLKVDGGRIVSGYLNLSPVTSGNRYSAYIIVE